MGDIKTMEELVKYVCKLVKQGVPISGVTIDEGFYWKINKSFSNTEATTIIGIPVCILKRYKYNQKSDFKIHTRGRE